MDQTLEEDIAHVLTADDIDGLGIEPAGEHDDNPAGEQA